MLFISSCLTRQTCHYRVYHYITIFDVYSYSVVSVPVRTKCYVSRASEDSGRAKIGARAPILSHFWLSPQFSRDQNLHSRATQTLATQAMCILVLAPVHTYPFSFENVTFSLRDLSSVHTYPVKTVTEKATFRKRSPKWRFLDGDDVMMTSQCLMSPKNDCVGG